MNNIDISKLKIGERVNYQPEHYREDEWPSSHFPFSQ